MTAHDQHRDPDPFTEVAHAIVEKVAGDEHHRFDPENNLIGALMYHPADKLAPLLAYVDDDDIEKVLPRAALSIIRQLVRRGIDPDPMTVAAALRDPQHAPTGPFDPDQIPGRYERLLRYIHTVYANGLNTGPRSAARQVVEDAYRRAFRDTGTGLAQRADAYADIQDLEHFTAAALHEWRRFHHRLAILTNGLPARDNTTPPPPPPDELDQDTSAHPG
ncbi:hypothetical protein [Nocardia asiatica]|uniref:hypothetical protein n=1 Tax=Nocardia asiatica TaxID=209252 RepID=UPI002458DC99|nr:hypothetical protein [Nocardia asiatica]